MSSDRQLQLSVCCAIDGIHRDQANGLVERLGCGPVLNVEGEVEGPCLCWIDGVLQLSIPLGGSICRVAIDFSSRDHGGRQNLSARQPLARAIGKKAGLVIDATAGFGMDSVLLARLGHHVLAIERNPVIFALLEDAVRRAEEANLLLAISEGLLRFEEGDAISILHHISPAPAVVYVDPMFPAKRKQSALPRKHIQLLKELVGEDGDSCELLEAALSCGCPRVVVKRPHHAPPLMAKPASRIETKLIR